MKTIAAGFACLSLSVVLSSAVAAGEFTPALQELAERQIKQMVNDPAVIAAIRAQNEKHAGMSEADIVALDDKWRAEIGSGATPTIDPVLKGALADIVHHEDLGG